MIAAFADRRPWAATVVALVIGPMLGMFYLGKGRLGLGYLLAELVAMALAVAANHLGLVHVDLWGSYGLLGIALRLAGCVHCNLVARKLDERRPRAWFARWFSVVGLYFLPFVAALLVRSFLYQPFNIPSGAMYPTLRIGDHVFVSKTSYGYGPYSLSYDIPLFANRAMYTAPQRGDVAVFRLPRDPKTDYVKRIVGLPGDRVQMKAGRLVINGEAVPRRRIADFTVDGAPGQPRTMAQYVETLPGGREHRVVEMQLDLGPLDNTAEYTVPPDHFFVMGDNRDNSLDSRMAQVGLIPKEHLIGRFTLIFWNSVDRKLRWVTAGEADAAP